MVQCEASFRGGWRGIGKGKGREGRSATKSLAPGPPAGPVAPFQLSFKPPSPGYQGPTPPFIQRSRSSVPRFEVSAWPRRVIRLDVLLRLSCPTATPIRQTYSVHSCSNGHQATPSFAQLNSRYPQKAPVTLSAMA